MSESRARFYLRELRRCRCGKPATVELLNAWNARFDVWCDPCGRRELGRRNAEAKK